MREEIIMQIIETQRLVNRVVKGSTLDSWLQLNLTIPQLKSLFYISRHQKVNLSGLAAGIHVTPANVTGIVDRLLEQELLTRTSDLNDRRILWLRVTDKAEALLSSLREGRTSRWHEILDCLTTEELNSIARDFDILSKAAEAIERGTVNG